jgi:hypothetical protein
MKELFEYIESLAFSAYANTAKDLEHMLDIIESDSIFQDFLASESSIDDEIIKRIYKFETFPLCLDFNPFDPQLVFYLKILLERKQTTRVQTEHIAYYVSELPCSKFAKIFADEILKIKGDEENGRRST